MNDNDKVSVAYHSIIAKQDKCPECNKILYWRQLPDLTFDCVFCGNSKCEKFLVSQDVPN
jgi:hypothetical protein